MFINLYMVIYIKEDDFFYINDLSILCFLSKEDRFLSFNVVFGFIFMEDD